VYFTDWKKDALTWMNKLWPGWDATLKRNKVKGIKSVGKFKTLQLPTMAANFSFAMRH